MFSNINFFHEIHGIFTTREGKVRLCKVELVTLQTAVTALWSLYSALSGNYTPGGTFLYWSQKQQKMQNISQTS